MLHYPTEAVERFTRRVWELNDQANNVHIVRESTSLKSQRGKRDNQSQFALYFHLSSEAMPVTTKLLDILKQFSRDHPGYFDKFDIIVADDANCMRDLNFDHQIYTIPTIILFKGYTEITRVTGAEPTKLVRLLIDAPRLCNAATMAPIGMNHQSNQNKTAIGNLNQEGLEELARRILTAAPFILFVKGSRWRPICKFSRRCLEVMQSVPGIPYKCWNVLDNCSLRETIASMASNKTFPQLWHQGRYLGGVTQISNMAHSGEIARLVETHRQSTLKEEEVDFLTKINANEVTVLIEGTPEFPMDGPSRQLILLLDICHVEYGSMNLDDADNRELLIRLFGKKGYWDEDGKKAPPVVFSKGSYAGDLQSISSTLATGGAKGVAELMEEPSVNLQ